MSVSFDTSVESHTGITGSVSEDFFDILITPSASVKGLLVFTLVNADADDALSVKINPSGANVDVPAVSGGRAIDNLGEPGDCKTWFLGSGLPAGGAEWTVRINRNNNANVMWAVAITVIANNNTEVYTPGIVLLEGDQALSEQNVDDGSPGTDSLRFAGVNFGGGAVQTAGANSTVLQDIDFGARIDSVVRENTAGQGSRPVGWTAAGSDDTAAVFLAVKESAVAEGGVPFFTTIGAKRI